MHFAKASTRNVVAMLVVSLLAMRAVAQPTTQPSADAVFDRLSRPAFTNREFYDAVIAGKVMTRTMGVDAFCNAAVHWSRDNARGNQLLNVVSSMVMGDFQLANQMAVHLNSSDAKLRKLAIDYFARFRAKTARCHRTRNGLMHLHKRHAI